MTQASGTISATVYINSTNMLPGQECTNWVTNLARCGVLVNCSELAATWLLATALRLTRLYHSTKHSCQIQKVISTLLPPNITSQPLLLSSCSSLFVAMSLEVASCMLVLLRSNICLAVLRASYLATS